MSKSDESSVYVSNTSGLMLISGCIAVHADRGARGVIAYEDDLEDFSAVSFQAAMGVCGDWCAVVFVYEHSGTYQREKKRKEKWSELGGARHHRKSLLERKETETDIGREKGKMEQATESEARQPGMENHRKSWLERKTEKHIGRETMCMCASINTRTSTGLNPFHLDWPVCHLRSLDVKGSPIQFTEGHTKKPSENNSKIAVFQRQMKVWPTKMGTDPGKWA